MADAFRPSNPDEPTADSGAPAPSVDAAAVREGPGSVIGRYKILQMIGEGGFGSVFMAEQTEPVVRRVALKIIKLGMDTRAVIARFEAERQALAMMDHPNIASVLDAGATDHGRPYFVMELVRGVPITQFCDDANLSIGERLRLFRQVCSAVQHAHQKGIIHRDLKPSNVLVTLHDGEPVPKVIDFGIAKATAQRLTEKTLFTAYGQFIGTPEYMAPEQAEMSGLDVDTRSDIYSLGVLLYELLTGTTPIDSARLRTAGFAEMQRLIRETETPRPSTRVGTSEGLVSIAAHRRTEPAKLGALIRGDLDWIVLKAIDKDRSRRYETANALSEDVRRYLDGEAVSAAPPTTAYRMRKFVRRNRAAVVAGLLIGSTLLLGILGTSLGMAWAIREQHHAAAETQRALDAESDAQERAMAAEAARREAEAVTDFLADMLSAVDPRAAGRDVLVRDVLEQAASGVGDRFADRPIVEARLRSVIGVTLMNLGLYEEAERHLPRALDLHQRHLGESHETTLTTAVRLVELLGLRGRAQEATRIIDSTIEVSRSALGPDHPVTLRAMQRRGSLLLDRGEYEAAVALYEELLPLASGALGSEHADAMKIRGNLAASYHRVGSTEDAAELFEEMMAIWRPALGADHPDTLRVGDNLAWAYKSLGRIDEAAALHEQGLAARSRVLGPEHPETLYSMSGLAAMRAEDGRYEEAAGLLERVLQVRSRVLGEEHPETLRTINSLAAMLRQLDREQEALALDERTLRARTRVLGEDHPDTLRSMYSVGVAYGRMDRDAESAALLERTLDARRRTLGEDHPDTVQTLSALAACYDALERLEGAVGLAQQALEARRRISGRTDPATVRARESLLDLLRKQNDADRLALLLREHLAVLRERADADGAAAEDARLCADALLIADVESLRDVAGAVRYAQRALQMAESSGDAPCECLQTLASALHATGDGRGAVDAQRRAIEALPADADDERRVAMQSRLESYEITLAGAEDSGG